MTDDDESRFISIIIIISTGGLAVKRDDFNILLLFNE